MKISRCCPKCSSNEILRIPGKLGPYGVGNNIELGKSALVKKCVLVTRYLCCSCGFSEEWIDSSEDIEKLKNLFDLHK